MLPVMIFLLFQQTTPSTFPLPPNPPSNIPLPYPIISIYQPLTYFIETIANKSKIQSDGDFGYTATVHLRGIVTFRTLPPQQQHRQPPVNPFSKICIFLHEMNKITCMKKQPVERSKNNQIILPARLPFDFTLDLSLGSYCIHVMTETIASHMILIDVVPKSTAQLLILPPPSLLPPPPPPSPVVVTTGTSGSGTSTESDIVSVALFVSPTIGGQQIFDLVKTRVLSTISSVDLHIIAEQPLDGEDSPLMKQYHEILSSQDSMSSIKSPHRLKDLVGGSNEMTTMFMTKKIMVLSTAKVWEDIKQTVVIDGTINNGRVVLIRTLLFPLFVLLQQIDVVSLPNSFDSPKMFNMLHVARLANVKKRIVELANVMYIEEHMSAATIFMGPSNYACNHRLISKLKNKYNIPCSVIHPVGIIQNKKLIEKEVNDVGDEGKGEEKGRENKSVTFASIGRLYINTSPGLFVRAAIQMVQLLYDKGINSTNVDFIFIGECVKTVCDMLQNLIMMVEPVILRPNIRFLGQVDNVMNAIVHKDVNVDVVVNTRLLETFGISIVEAMSIGIPVIACRGGGHNEMIENGVDGILLDCVDEKSGEEDDVAGILANAMVDMLLNEEMRMKLGESSKISSKKKFNENVLRSKLIESYML